MGCGLFWKTKDCQGKVATAELNNKSRLMPRKPPEGSGSHSRESPQQSSCPKREQRAVAVVETGLAEEAAALRLD